MDARKSGNVATLFVAPALKTIPMRARGHRHEAQLPRYRRFEGRFDKATLGAVSA